MVRSDIIRGHLDSIILRLISEKDRYGYEISQEISLRTNNRFQIKEATLYAVFQRLEKKKLLKPIMEMFHMVAKESTTVLPHWVRPI